MPIQICCACGTSYPDTVEPPSRCLICEDERQFVPPGGQVWTTPDKLAGGHVNAWRQLEEDLFEISPGRNAIGRMRGLWTPKSAGHAGSATPRNHDQDAVGRGLVDVAGG